MIESLYEDLDMYLSQYDTAYRNNMIGEMGYIQAMIEKCVWSISKEATIVFKADGRVIIDWEGRDSIYED